MLRSFFKEEGLGPAEYALIPALVAMIAIGAPTFPGREVDEKPAPSVAL